MDDAKSTRRCYGAEDVARNRLLFPDPSQERERLRLSQACNLPFSRGSRRAARLRFFGCPPFRFFLLVFSFLDDHPRRWMSNESDLQDAVGSVRASNYISIAVFVWGLYDHIICIDEEVAWYTSVRLNKSKIAYLVNRYTFLTAFSVRVATALRLGPDYDSVCRPVTIFLLFSNILLHTIANIAMVLRVRALFEHHRTIKRTLYTSVVLYILLSVTVVVVTWRHGIRAFPGLLPILPGCFAIPPKSYWAAFVVDFMFDAFIFSLTTLGICAWRSRLGFQSPSRAMPLTTHLLNAGIGYFAVITASLAFAVVVSFTSWTRVLAPTGFTVAVSSLASSRMLLALHKKLEDRPQPAIDIPSIELTAAVSTRFQAAPQRGSDEPRRTVDATVEDRNRVLESRMDDEVPAVAHTLTQYSWESHYAHLRPSSRTEMELESR
ncbi:hypothetical protein EXIGLDRAFT_836529 [Exidia glandulosa HHB12029]|uniref:DUF6533 domain-containing protein n=1 Tax=Exidia glandulosa HHB12029 TaxID=1314781 RepID=A0A165HR15_EXIGL|nr:hypothetical protein EXIGLDRAFT_836529 [Exidia glandulosa HHB12029]